MKIYILPILICISFQIQGQDVKISFDNKIYEKQKGEYWCWSAVLSIVTQHKYGFKTQQEEIVSSFFKQNIDLITLQKDQYDTSISEEDFIEILSKNEINKISYNQIKPQIVAGNPVVYIKQLDYNKHTAIIIGFNKDFFIVYDTDLDMFLEYKKDYFNGNTGLYSKKP